MRREKRFHSDSKTWFLSLATGSVSDQQQDLQDPPKGLQEHGPPQTAVPVLQPADRHPRQPAAQRHRAAIPRKPNQQNPEGRLQRAEEAARVG